MCVRKMKRLAENFWGSKLPHATATKHSCSFALLLRINFRSKPNTEVTSTDQTLKDLLTPRLFVFISHWNRDVGSPFPGHPAALHREGWNR